MLRNRRSRCARRSASLKCLGLERLEPRWLLTTWQNPVNPLDVNADNHVSPSDVLYVVNKLIAEVENARDAKIRVAALSKLGEIDGVDAFKKRSEMTVKVQPIEEVEKELLETLSNIEAKVIDVEAREVVFGDRKE